VSSLPVNYATSTGAPPSPPPAAETPERPGVLVGLMVLGLYIMGLAFFTSLWPTYRVKYVYVATTAEVLDTRITQREYVSRKSRRLLPCPQVRICYIAAGRPYDSWIDVYYFPTNTDDPAKNAAAVARLKPGTSVSAWYDPDQPDHAVVSREYRSWVNGLFSIALGVSFFFCGAYGCFSIRRSRNARRDHPEAQIDHSPQRADEA
jgi:hypothetical protein